jgi:hypothetical protein
MSTTTASTWKNYTRKHKSQRRPSHIPFPHEHSTVTSQYILFKVGTYIHLKNNMSYMKLLNPTTVVTVGNPHRENSRFCKEIREDNFRFWWGSSRRHFARYVHVKYWNLIFYCSNIAKSENVMLWRMLSRLETCIVFCCIWSVTLAKSFVPRKTWRKLWHSYISKLLLTKMQVKFSIFFHHGSLNVIGDKFRFVRSKLKSR